MQGVVDLWNLTLRLRRECPWDQEQTVESILPHTVSEVWELVDAATAWCETPGDKSLADFEDELGDLFFQVCFLSMLLSERYESVDLNSVANRVHEKLVERHPHVFATNESQRYEEVKTSDDVRRIWQQVKQQNRAEEKESHIDNVLGRDSSISSPLRSALDVQHRAGTVGFDFGGWKEAFTKVREEADELFEALEHGVSAEVVHEVGDLIFAVVNVARLAGVEPDVALRGTNARFRQRLARAHEIASTNGEDWCRLDLDSQEHYYRLARDENRG